MANLVLCLNLISTWYMVGLIWLVQCVHYPLFAKVSAENYVQYQQLHERYITPVVGAVSYTHLTLPTTPYV